MQKPEQSFDLDSGVSNFKFEISNLITGVQSIMGFASLSISRTIVILLDIIPHEALTRQQPFRRKYR